MSDFRPQTVDIRWPSAFGIFGLGVIVGAILCVFQVAQIKLSSGADVEIDMEYSDLIAIILTALGVMIALFSVGLAVLAFIGYQQLKDGAAKRAGEHAEAEVKRQLKEGGELRTYLRETILLEVYGGIPFPSESDGSGSDGNNDDPH